MSEGYKIRSLSEIVNEILSTVRSYYDAEYAYYIEKDRGDIETIYEWCDENIEWQRDRMKLSRASAEMDENRDYRYDGSGL